MEIVVDTVSQAYSLLRKELQSAPLYGPRGLLTAELLGVSVKINKPEYRVMYNPKRKFNLAFAISEFAALVNGVNRVEFVSYFNKNVEQFSDDGKKFYGAYGPRINKAIADVLLKLTSDNDTRQAVISIYKNDDLVVVTKDVPCTIALQFFIRDGALNMITMMRSNDFIWGFPYDVFCFTSMQELIANELKLELGWYRHVVSSLHVYERHFDLLASIESQESEEMHYTGDLVSAGILASVIDKIINDDYDKIIEYVESIMKISKGQMGLSYIEYILAAWFKKKYGRFEQSMHLAKNFKKYLDLIK